MWSKDTVGRAVQELGDLAKRPLPHAWRQIHRRLCFTDPQTRLVLAVLAVYDVAQKD